MTLHEHVPHPHIARREKTGPVKVADQHAAGNAVQRWNARLAVGITRAVGSMWCAYAFGLFDLISLPEAVKAGTAAIISWVAQTFLQLVLLSIIMVGQDVQAKAADKQNAQQFGDVEAILHGQGEQARHLAAQDDQILAILGEIKANTELTQQVAGLIGARRKASAAESRKPT
jgi:hypothetical protein